jgi:hypothetical protein
MKKAALLLLLFALVPLRAAAFNTSELLSLVAMPLAVAAVADLTGVPQDRLGTLVSSLNQANVPPTQFVEVVRYVPVTLVENDQTDFVQWLQSEIGQGVTGSQLVSLIAQQLQTSYNLTPQITVTAPTPQAIFTPTPSQTIIVDQNYIPPVVRTRVIEYRTHPHGGPPGQIKKALGLQTGAEVVHGQKPGRPFRQESVADGKKHREGEIKVVQQPVPQPAPPMVVAQPHGRGPGGGGPPGLEKKGGVPPGQEKKGGPEGKSGGKGHGKD